jgi:hypothetical protein
MNANHCVFIANVNVRASESQQPSEALESSFAAQLVAAVSSSQTVAQTTNKHKKSKKDKRGDDMAFLVKDLIHFKAKKMLAQSPSSQISVETPVMDTLVSTASQPSPPKESPLRESPPSAIVSHTATAVSASASLQEHPTTENLLEAQLQPQITPHIDTVVASITVNGANINCSFGVPATLEQENRDHGESQIEHPKLGLMSSQAQNSYSKRPIPRRMRQD